MKKEAEKKEGGLDVEGDLIPFPQEFARQVGSVMGVEGNGIEGDLTPFPKEFAKKVCKILEM